MDALTGDAILRIGQLVLVLLLMIAVVIAATRSVLLIVDRRHLKRRDMVWLEITPPSSIAKTPEATEQLFSVIHGVRAGRRTHEVLLWRVPVMSFEIVSTRREGIRYMVHVERHRSDSLQKAISSYHASIKVKETTHDTKPTKHVVEFKEAGHYILPLTLMSAFERHDPLAYITGVMTKLQEDEQITLQLVVKPVKLLEARRLSRRILGNENILEQVNTKHGAPISRVTNLFNTAMIHIIDTANEFSMGTTYGYKKYYDAKQKRLQQETRTTLRDRPSRTLSAFELELMETMHRKVTQPLFQVNLRILVKSQNAKAHIATLKGALDGFSVPPYQSLQAKLQLPIIGGMRIKAGNTRMPSLTKHGAMILSASELASLYHFPASDVSDTDNLVVSLSRTLAAPLSLKQDTKLDVVIGENIHHGITTPIGLTEAERERHIYIIGGTGNGKTTMLQYQIVQDMQSGKGVAVVDPHGDMAETLLRYIPPERVKDVVYFNPDDLEFPIGLNLLELTQGLEGNELLREKDIITESVVSVFRKIFSEDDSGGHRIEYVLRNTVQTALTTENPTLFTVYNLLNDKDYRAKVIKTLENKDLKNFWKQELGKAGDMQKVKMSAGITAKIGRFLFSASAKQILEQPRSTIDFDDILNSGKILVCNFSKGRLGEDTSELFGITILAKLQLASLRRARIEQSDRRPFYLYVDEFQNFATSSFVQMLSEARKYRLFLTMAEQSTSQQDDQQMVNIILANVGTVICFRTGNPQDERSLLPLFRPFIEEGEISNLPAYNFYAKLAAVKAQEPLSGQTLLLQSKGSKDIATAVVAISQVAFARKQEITPTPPPKKKTEAKNIEAEQGIKTSASKSNTTVTKTGATQKEDLFDKKD